MNVLVWQSYGNVNVYAADAVGNLNVIIDDIATSTATWGVDDAFDEMVKRVSTLCEQHDLRRARRVINDFVHLVLNKHEAFETFEFTIIRS